MTPTLMLRGREVGRLGEATAEGRKVAVEEEGEGGEEEVEDDEEDDVVPEAVLNVGVGMEVIWG